MTDLQDAMPGADPLQCWEPPEHEPEMQECGGDPDPGWGEPDVGHGHLDLDLDLDWDHGGDWGDLDL